MHCREELHSFINQQLGYVIVHPEADLVLSPGSKIGEQLFNEFIRERMFTWLLEGHVARVTLAKSCTALCCTEILGTCANIRISLVNSICS